MKRGNIKFELFLTLILALLLLNIGNVSAASICTISADLVNQDPYPAIAGDYVEVLFQLDGIGNSCDEGAIAHLVLDYPFSLDNGDSVRIIKSTTYAGEGHSSKWNLIYNLRIDPDAKEGDYEVELRYKDRGEFNQDDFVSKKFNITLEDGLTDFEVHIEDHNIASKNLVFEILNTGNQDIEALTVEVPKQDNIIIKGSNRNIVGDLDSNEFTTTDFEATPSEGKIDLIFYYTDSTNERRMIEKTVFYDSTYFIGSIDNTAPSQTTNYVIGAVIVILLLFFIIRKKKNNKKSKRGKFNV